MTTRKNHWFRKNALYIAIIAISTLAILVVMIAFASISTKTALKAEKLEITKSYFSEEISTSYDSMELAIMNPEFYSNPYLIKLWKDNGKCINIAIHNPKIQEVMEAIEDSNISCNELNHLITEIKEKGIKVPTIFI